MQILDVVANIQAGILKAEVEKGSRRTVFGPGLVVSKSVAQLRSWKGPLLPWAFICAEKEGATPRKRIRSIFLNLPPSKTQKLLDTVCAHLFKYFLNMCAKVATQNGTGNADTCPEKRFLFFLTGLYFYISIYKIWMRGLKTTPCRKTTLSR